MKAACLLTDSVYNLVVSNRGGKSKEGPSLGFTGLGKGAGGDGIAGARSVGRGGVQSKVGVESEASVETSSGWVLPVSFDLAFNPGSCLPLDSVDFEFVLNIIDVWRFCSTSVGGRSGNSVRFETFSSRIGLLQKKRFRVETSVHISAKMVSILAE